MLLIRNLRLPNDLNVNFSLKEGELMLIHGPNGSGKSLLMKSIAFLLSNFHDEFTFEGKDLHDWKPELYRSKVLYVPSSTFNLDLSVEEYLDHPKKLAVYQGMKWSDEPRRLVRELGLTGRPLSLLSMGQRQILSLIRAIHLDARILLLDEPTSHLDPAKSLVAEGLIKDWQERTGGSAVIVGHDHGMAQRLGVRETLFAGLVV